MEHLHALGWTASFQRQYEALDVAERIPARVSWQSRGQYGLLTPDAQTGVLAGRLEYNAADARDLPCVGDWVLARSVGELGVIEHVFERSSLLARKAAGRATDVQPLAANVDVALIVAAFGDELNVRRLERYITVVADSGASPVIVLNKMDLASDPDETARVLQERTGCTIIALSALHAHGLSPLLDALGMGRTACLIGSSGVGKSTLTNALLGTDTQIVQDIRADDHKGRHTTVRRELFTMPGGAMLIDTPGMRELMAWDESGGIEAAFPDIEDSAKHCRYRDCTHEQEPGCAVVGQVEPDRVRSYKKMLRERAHIEDRSNKKKRWKAVTKAMRVRRKIDPKLAD